MHVRVTAACRAALGVQQSEVYGTGHSLVTSSPYVASVSTAPPHTAPLFPNVPSAQQPQKGTSIPLCGDLARHPVRLCKVGGNKS